MSDLRTAAQQALEALEGWDNYEKWVWPESALEQAKRNTTESLASLRAALAQQDEPVQEPVEPVGQLQEAAFGRGQVMWFDKPADGTKLYAAPPERLPLTEDDLRKLADKHLFYQTESYEASGVFVLSRAVEQAHGIGEQP